MTISDTPSSLLTRKTGPGSVPLATLTTDHTTPKEEDSSSWTTPASSSSPTSMTTTSVLPRVLVEKLLAASSKEDKMKWFGSITQEWSAVLQSGGGLMMASSGTCDPILLHCSSTTTTMDPPSEETRLRVLTREKERETHRTGEASALMRPIDMTRSTTAKCEKDTLSCDAHRTDDTFEPTFPTGEGRPPSQEEEGYSSASHTATGVIEMEEQIRRKRKITGRESETEEEQGRGGGAENRIVPLVSLAVMKEEMPHDAALVSQNENDESHHDKEKKTPERRRYSWKEALLLHEGVTGKERKTPTCSSRPGGTIDVAQKTKEQQEQEEEKEEEEEDSCGGSTRRSSSPGPRPPEKEGGWEELSRLIPTPSSSSSVSRLTSAISRFTGWFSLSGESQEKQIRTTRRPRSRTRRELVSKCRSHPARLVDSIHGDGSETVTLGPTTQEEGQWPGMGGRRHRTKRTPPASTTRTPLTIRRKEDYEEEERKRSPPPQATFSTEEENAGPSHSLVPPMIPWPPTASTSALALVSVVMKMCGKDEEASASAWDASDDLPAPLPCSAMEERQRWRRTSTKKTREKYNEEEEEEHRATDRIEGNSIEIKKAALHDHHHHQHQGDDTGEDEGDAIVQQRKEELLAILQRITGLGGDDTGRAASQKENEETESVHHAEEDVTHRWKKFIVELRPLRKAFFQFCQPTASSSSSTLIHMSAPIMTATPKTSEAVPTSTKNSTEEEEEEEEEKPSWEDVFDWMIEAWFGKGIEELETEEEKGRVVETQAPKPEEEEEKKEATSKETPTALEKHTPPPRLGSRAGASGCTPVATYVKVPPYQPSAELLEHLAATAAAAAAAATTTTTPLFSYGQPMNYVDPSVASTLTFHPHPLASPLIDTPMTTTTTTLSPPAVPYAAPWYPSPTTGLSSSYSHATMVPFMSSTPTPASYVEWTSAGSTEETPILTEREPGPMGKKEDTGKRVEARWGARGASSSPRRMNVHSPVYVPTHQRSHLVDRGSDPIHSEGTTMTTTPVPNRHFSFSSLPVSPYPMSSTCVLTSSGTGSFSSCSHPAPGLSLSFTANTTTTSSGLDGEKDHDSEEAGEGEDRRKLLPIQGSAVNNDLFHSCPSSLLNPDHPLQEVWNEDRKHQRETPGVRGGDGVSEWMSLPSSSSALASLPCAAPPPLLSSFAFTPSAVSLATTTQRTPRSTSLPTRACRGGSASYSSSSISSSSGVSSPYDTRTPPSSSITRGPMRPSTSSLFYGDEEEEEVDPPPRTTTAGRDRLPFESSMDGRGKRQRKKRITRKNVPPTAEDLVEAEAWKPGEEEEEEERTPVMNTGAPTRSRRTLRSGRMTTTTTSVRDPSLSEWSLPPSAIPSAVLSPTPVGLAARGDAEHSRFAATSSTFSSCTSGPSGNSTFSTSTTPTVLPFSTPPPPSPLFCALSLPFSLHYTTSPTSSVKWNTSTMCGATGSTTLFSLPPPTSLSSFSTPFEYILVLDFEATCEEITPEDYVHEIIEFPVVLVDTQLRRPVAEFRSFVRPREKPVLSDFCKSLTGIRQEDVDTAPSLDSVLQSFERWLQRLVSPRSRVIFATDGSTDLQGFMYQDAVCQLGYHFPSVFYTWIDVKRVFSAVFQCPPGKIKGMLEVLHLPMEGRLHSGIDDARNIASIVIGLLQCGSNLMESPLRKIHPPPPSILPASSAAFVEDVQLHPQRWVGRAGGKPRRR